MLDWTDEELEDAGLDPKRVRALVRKLRSASKELQAMDLKVYGASGGGHLIHASRPTHNGINATPDQEASIADLGNGFDGGDW